MKMKSIITVLVAAAFLLSLASPSLAAGAEKMGVSGTGTVTKIEGNMATVQDDMGKETTVDVKDVKDIKIGDKIKIEDGVVKNSTDELGTSEKPKKPGY